MIRNKLQGVQYFQGAGVLDREKVLASKCRQKILRTLARNSQVRIMQLVRETGFSYNEVDRNLHVLEESGAYLSATPSWISGREFEP